MNTFSNAVKNQKTTTTNGMVALKSTGNASVSLFYKIGASRGKNIIPDFVAAFAENRDYALRIAQWARDIRGGAGERQIFRDILTYLETNDPDASGRFIHKIPELGRIDDLFSYQDPINREKALQLFATMLTKGVEAKNILNKLDEMTEEECETILETF